MPGSNRRPLPCEGSALPAAPIAHQDFATEPVGRGFDTSRRSGANAHRRAGADPSSPARRGTVRTRGANRLRTAGRHPSLPCGYAPRHARDAGRFSAVDRRKHPGSFAQFGTRSPFRLESSLSPEHGDNADVAQLVAHHLAKVRVASSSLVIRSDRSRAAMLGFVLRWLRPRWQHRGETQYGEASAVSNGARWIGREARQRPAKPYTRVRIPYPPPQADHLLGLVSSHGRLAQR